MPDDDAATPATFHQHIRAHTPEEREAAFQAMVQRSVDKLAKLIEAGREPVPPWFESEEQRRELFMRRYRRPAPPQGLTLDINRIRGVKPDPPVTPTELETAA